MLLAGRFRRLNRSRPTTPSKIVGREWSETFAPVASVEWGASSRAGTGRDSVEPRARKDAGPVHDLDNSLFMIPAREDPPSQGLRRGRLLALPPGLAESGGRDSVEPRARKDKSPVHDPDNGLFMIPAREDPPSQGLRRGRLLALPLGLAESGRARLCRAACE